MERRRTGPRQEPQRKERDEGEAWGVKESPAPSMTSATSLVSVRVARHKSVMDDSTRTEVEAAVFRRLVQHFRERTDVQNIDVMNLAGFCRNCLAKWYGAAAAERGVELADAEARELVYGMPYTDWKAKHQK